MKNKVISDIEKEYIDTLGRWMNDLEVKLFLKLEKIAHEYDGLTLFNIWDVWRWQQQQHITPPAASSNLYLVVEYLVYRYSEETLPADDDLLIREVNDCFNDNDITNGLEYIISLIKEYINKYVDTKQFKNMEEARDYFIKAYTKMQQREVKKFERKLYKVIGGKKWEVAKN